MLKRILFIAVAILLSRGTVLSQTACSLQVKTYPATCNGGADGKAEIWKDGQLVVIDPGNPPLVCTPPESPTLICGSIPSGAIDNPQTSGEIVVDNQTMYLTASSFTGTLRFEGGGTLVICGNATITNYNFNETVDPIFININGSMLVTAPHLDLNSNVTVTNYGTLKVKGAGFNGKLYNHQLIEAEEDFSVNSIAGVLYNTGTLTMMKSFLVNQSAVFTNNGLLSVGVDLKNNSSGSIVNNCNITVGNEFHQNAPTLNSGVINVTNATVLNTNIYKGNSGSLLLTRDLGTNTIVEGIGSTCASIKVTRNINFINSGALFRGKVDLCGVSVNSMYIQSPASNNCSCTPTSGGGGSGIGGTITWSSGTSTLSGSTVTGLTAGTYTVDISLNGCNPLNDVTFTIGQPDPLVASATINSSTKVATVSASGGNGQTYSYHWSDGVISSANTRNFSTNTEGTYCVTVKDSKGCQSNQPCIVVPPVTPVDTNDCRISVEYLAGNLVFIDGKCVCPYKIINPSYPEGVASITLPVPCQDSIVYMQNCKGEITSVTLEGKNNGCNPGTCPNPDNPSCPDCPDPNNPACCLNPPCCIAALDPSCNPCSPGDTTCQKLVITSQVTPPGCNAGGKAVLTISGGSGKYLTSNPKTNDDGVNISGLPAGATVIKITDLENGTVAYHTVDVPAAPESVVSIINSADPAVAVNNHFTIQITSAHTGPYDVALGEISPYRLSGLQATGGALTVGPIALPSGIGNGPFPVKITDKYCTEYNYTVYRSLCQDPALAGFVAAVTETVPSYQGKSDGSLTLTNLPSGYTAIWSGEGFLGKREGTALSGIGAGEYTLVIKNNTSGCIASVEKILKDGKVIVPSATVDTEGSCTYGISGHYKDADGNVLPGSLTPTVIYQWENPENGEILSVSNEYKLDAKTLYGKPAYLKYKLTDGAGNSAMGTLVIPADCYPTGCHPSDPICCPDPNDPDCHILTVTYTATPPKCGQLGSVQLTVTGGLGDYGTSNLINDQTGLYISELPAGTHSVYVFDRKTFKGQVENVVIPETPKSEFEIINSLNPSLGENSSYTIAIPNAGTGPYSIQFEGFEPYYAANVSVTNGSLGTYPVPQDKGNGPFFITVEDSYCNKYPLQVYRNDVICNPISGIPDYIPQIAKTIPSSQGQYNGSVSISNLPIPSGTTAIWTGTGFVGSREGTTLNGLPAGEYKVVIKNKTNDCHYPPAKVILNDGPTLSGTYKLSVSGSGCEFTMQASMVDDFGNVVNPPSNLQYAWINPYTNQPVSTSATLNVATLNLPHNPGYLKIEVSDGTKTGSNTFDIPESCIEDDPCLTKLEYTVTSPTCPGGSDGAIHVKPANVIWVTPEIIRGNAYGWDKTGLSQGRYEIQLHHGSCFKTYWIGVVDPAPMVITREDFNPRSTRILVENGTAPYSYKWSDQSTSTDENTRSGLVAGSEYEVEVTDVKGCKDTLTFVYDPCAVSRPDGYPVHSLEDKRVTIMPNGGLPDYEFFWDRQGGTQLNNQYGDTKFNLPEDIYHIYITDANGCKDTVIYMHPCQGGSMPEFSLDTIPASSPDICDGEVTLQIGGNNVEEYVIIWDKQNILQLLQKTDGLRAIRHESTVKIFNVCSGPHEVFVKNGGDNSCGVRMPFTLGSGPHTGSDCQASTLAIHTIGETSFAKNCDTIPVNLDFYVTGGKMQYRYEWEYTPEGATESLPVIKSDKTGFSDAQPGTYKLTVYDAEDCFRTKEFTVTGPLTNLSSTHTVVQPVCAGGAGTATVIPSGGSGTKTITWFGEDDIHTFIRNDLTGTKTYGYKVTDDNLCVSTGAVTITDPVLLPSFQNDTLFLCAGKTATLAAHYRPQYNVSWSSETPGVTITNPGADMITVSQPGLYVLTRTHKNSPAQCPAQSESIEVVLKTDCTPVGKPCETFTYELPAPVVHDACTDNLKFSANADAMKQYQDYLEVLKRDFTNQYTSNVMSSLKEKLVMSFGDNEQHYTLYYYDQAGNLVRTVPPAGVRPLTPSQTTQVENYWLTSTDNNPANDPDEVPEVVTEHTLATTYRYNSLNQLIAQDMPDHTQQDLWDYKNTFTLPGGQTISTLDAYGSKVWAFANNNTTGQAFLYTSTDAGATFIPGLHLNLGNIMDIQRAGSTGEVYFAVGTGGLLLKASNGAANWTLLQGPTTTNLLKVHFTDQNNGFIINSQGAVWRTTTGGVSWTSSATTAQYLSSNLGSLAAELMDKTIADIKVRENKIYLTANDATRGYVYVSTDLINFSFIRQDFRMGTVNAATYNGADADFISGQYIFRRGTSNTVQYHRKTDLPGTVTQYVSNGTVHIVKTSSGIFKSTDGITFTAAGNGLTGNCVIVNSNGRIALYEGNNIYKVETNGTLTNLIPGNNTGVNAYYYNGTNDYVALNPNLILNVTGNLTYNLSSSNVGYFSQFTIESSGNVALVYANSNVAAVKLAMTTVAPIQPVTSAGNVLYNYRELRRIGSATYAIGHSNQVYPLSVNNSGANPVVSAAASIHTIIPDYPYSLRSFAFGASANSYTYVTNDNKTYQVVGGAAPVEVRLAPAPLTSTAMGNDNTIYATSSGGVLYRHTAWDNVMDFTPLSNSVQNLTAATTSSDSKLRVVTADHKIHKLSVSGSVYSLVEEPATPPLNSAVKSISNDYLLTTNGQVYMATNTTSNGITTSAWAVQSAVTLNNYNVINGANPTILAGGNNAAISYKSGAVWAAAAAFKVQPILDVAISSDGQDLVAVGKQGTILSSDNGGASFTPVFAPNVNDLTSVSLSGNGFITGDASGNLLYYSNGVTPATANITGGTASGGQAIRKIYNSPRGGIWALRGRQLLYSADGSSFDAKLTASVNKELNDIQLRSDGYGYIAGNLGAAYRIVPAGIVEEAESAVLTPLSIGGGLEAKLIATDNNIVDDEGTGIPPSHLRTVLFTDRLKGYLTGTGGIVLKTTDGGYHWHPEGQYTNSSDESPLLAVTGGEKGVFSDINTIGTFRDRALQIGSRFWYDELGRLVLSQNSKQYNIESYLGESIYEGLSIPGTGKISAYSYTLYDDIGRITEVGELLTRRDVDTAKHETQVKYNTIKTTFVPSGKKVQITRTYYDRAAFAGLDPDFTQENLRPRVASVTYQEQEGTDYDRGTHYSYDIHGNVKALVQEIRTIQGQAAMQPILKRIDYEYDLISGKVNFVYFQKGKEDGFSHKYLYDGDNRITEVYTSTDNVIWNKEAAYDYYAHGPLARTVTGRDNIDQCDYAYTLQGWIKGVQSQNFAYALGYYNNGTLADYDPIGSPTLQATPMAKSLFNGNISTMTTHTPAFAGQGMTATFTQQFTYDQLNRITGSALAGGTNAYRTHYEYDPNGNISILDRYNKDGNQFDHMAYKYHKVDNGYLRNTNRLRWVEDTPGFDGVETTDIDKQERDNYEYDDIGNLIRDVDEGIARIEWNVYGKVHSVLRADGSGDQDLYFSYDASGNRIAKKAVSSTGSSTITYYLRDASGNVMATYQSDGTRLPELEEQHIYGSSRIGMYKSNGITFAGLSEGIVQGEHKVGLRSYELSDHLGNVHVVLSDLRKAENGILKSHALAAYEYYPFGMILQKIEPSTGYRYKYNGKEMDDEGMGGGSSTYDYGFRIYNPAIAKFLSVDPLTRTYAMLTPYQYASNSPVMAVDIDGLEGAGANQIDYTWVGGIVLAKADYLNFSDQIASEIHAYLDPRLPSGFRVRTTYTVQYDKDGVSEVVENGSEIVPTEVAREGLFFNFVGTSLIPFQFVDFVGARGTILSSAKSLVPMFKKSASELLSSFNTGSITRDAFKAVSYTRLRGNLVAAGNVAQAGDQAHHLIPLSTVLKSEVVQKASSLGFDFNSVANGEFVNIFTHLGKNFFNHPIYNQYADNLVNNLKGLEGDDLLKGMDTVLEELRDVVNTAKSSGKTLDEVAATR